VTSNSISVKPFSLFMTLYLVRKSLAVNRKPTSVMQSATSGRFRAQPRRHGYALYRGLIR
jgi:hypothetical protein